MFSWSRTLLHHWRKSIKFSGKMLHLGSVIYWRYLWANHFISLSLSFIFNQECWIRWPLQFYSAQSLWYICSTLLFQPFLWSILKHLAHCLSVGSLAPDGSRIVQILTDCELGCCIDGKDAMASVIHQVPENFRENSIYVDDGKG